MLEQFFTFIGVLKARAISWAMFSYFGEEVLLDRLGDSRVGGIITKSLFL